MSLPVVIVPRAKAELLAAAEWWAKNRSVDQAERWYDGFLAAIESLRDHPDRCGLARENAKFAYELRELHYGLGSRPTHRALFSVRPDFVSVVCIRHLAQDDLDVDDL